MTMMLDFTVGTADLRKALIAVTPHASDDPEHGRLWRVRFNVAAGSILIGATDRFTAALSTVSVWALGDAAADEGVFDIAPSDVKKILAVFKTGRETRKEEGSPQWLCRIQIHAEQFPSDDKDAPDVTVPMITCTDVSGLIPGEQLEFTLLPTEEAAPDLPTLFARVRARPPAALDAVTIAGDLLARLKTACAAYDASLVLTSHGSSLVCYCGDSFIGLVSPLQMWKDDRTRFDSEISGAWTTRLPATGFDLATAAGVMFSDPESTKDGEQ